MCVCLETDSKPLPPVSERWIFAAQLHLEAGPSTRALTCLPKSLSNQGSRLNFQLMVSWSVFKSDFFVVFSYILNSIIIIIIIWPF